MHLWQCVTLAAPSIVRKRRGTCFQYTCTSSSTLLPWNPEKQGPRRSHSTLGVLSLPHELGLPNHHRPTWYNLPPQIPATNMLSYSIGYLDLNRKQTRMKISSPWYFHLLQHMKSPLRWQDRAVLHLAQVEPHFHPSEHAQSFSNTQSPLVLIPPEQKNRATHAVTAGGSSSVSKRAHFLIFISDLLSSGLAQINTSNLAW